MAFGGNVFEPEVPVEVAEEAEKRANADAALEAEIDLLEPGAWTKVTSFGAKVEKGAPEVEVRLLSALSKTVQFRGAFKIKAGEELKAGEEAFLLPAEFRPETSTRRVAVIDGTKGTQVDNLFVPTTGKVVTGTEAASLKAAEEVSLDGVTYTL